MRKFILIAIAGLLVYSVITTISLSKHRKIASEKDNILKTKEQTYINKLGQVTSETKVWSQKYQELENAHAKSIAQGKKNISDYEARLSEAYSNIELYKRKERDLISYYSAQLNVSDTIYTVMSGDCVINPINGKYLSLNFIPKNDSLGVDYRYKTGISTVVMLTPKRKSNGHKHFPNWGFIWGWDKVSITKADDPNASLTNQVSLEFNK